MITSLSIENYKCFSRLKIELGKLTLLTGVNAGGKSSAIQPLALLAQSLRAPSSEDTLLLNGPLVKLGTFGDVLPANSSNPNVTFSIASDVDDISWRLTSRSGERQMKVEKSASSNISSNTTEKQLAVESSLLSLSYLSSVREGTADSFPLPELTTDETPDVGVDGRFAAYWYDRCADDEISPLRLHPSESATSFRKQMDAWFSTLFPGAGANAQLVSAVQLASLQFRSAEFGEWRRPANVGYGYTYAFPILVALLAAHEGQVVIIDSPEAHLHPFAQSQMGRLIAHFSAAGVQIIVETHSDHFLNGVRLAVKEGALLPENLRIHFFSGSSEQDHGVRILNIDSNGRIDSWPEGFFDQAEKDLARLSGWI